MLNHRVIALLSVLVCATGCVAGAPDGPEVGTNADALVSSNETYFIASLSEAQKAGVLALVNDEATTEARLDDGCGLYSDTAKHIVKARGREGGFQTMTELADVHQVGIATLQTLVRCADDYGYGEEGEFYLGTMQEIADYDPALAALVQDLMQQGNPCDECGNPELWWACNPIRLGDIWAPTAAGQVLRFEIRLLQMVDPEGGIQLTINYTVNPEDLSVTSVECYI